MMTLSDSCRVTLCLVPSRLWYGEEAPHSCLVAPVEVGMGEENKESTGTWKHTIKELTVPKDETTGKFAKCKMYQVNFTQTSICRSTEKYVPSGSRCTKECAPLGHLAAQCLPPHGEDLSPAF
ncbi:hypothetical protein Pcinc_003811 [Petrolisthes cinctipes]|uniref:Uncharacterized protein n=1 Tax=Petrolisthes cinctipes TaxID=88211 RepID=A0AAE1L1R7_PETCI|nr:hypothetical protein Pcinc_003811 [Petrolisthes cinctipes]